MKRFNISKDGVFIASVYAERYEITCVPGQTVGSFYVGPVLTASVDTGNCDVGDSGGRSE